jgi:hypothetical protein
MGLPPIVDNVLREMRAELDDNSRQVTMGFRKLTIRDGRGV